MKILNLIKNKAPTQEILEAIKTATIQEINYKGEFGWTPLHEAIYWGYLEITKTLIEAGANVNVVDEEGWTPLHFAACRGHFEIVKTLIEKGENVNAKDNDGETPLDVAKREGHKEIVEFLENYNK